MTAPARFTKADVKRAVSGMLAAGVPIAKIEIEPNGKIAIIPANQNDKQDGGEWADLE